MDLLILVVALVGLCAFLQWRSSRQLDTLLNEQAAERALWVAERRDLNNRIQVPEAAPFMDPEQPPIQHVPFDDDDAFNEAREELSA